VCVSYLIRRSLCAFALLGAATVGLRGDASLTKRDADSLLRKLVQINENAAVPRAKSARATTVTEPEVNAYLRYHARGEIPPGVTDPYVTIVGSGRLEGRATVDLDAVRRQKKRGWLDPLGYLTGRLPIEASGVLQTSEGVGRFTLDSASVGGVPVPKVVLQEIVSHYSRRPEDPDGVGLDDAFELPARIREIKVGTGQAVVIQ
jgi:hypothetical protein